ncbi:hypothetical protein SBI_04385 [Streptomyces bingchenggensis BCW-1]|uniref:Uncharacterized protein n=1 Tax=Streptomyces bingchenggensis (strain BCW-1) TaxID=749414 RepID=D7BVA4_STRBB|nr:hypothetical protein SBI_04385 [Streptomyces bingchenggensis BCW-1]
MKVPVKVPVKVPYRRRRPGAASPAVRHRLAWRDMEWQMLRILLIFRLMHGIQLAVTVPGIAGHTRHPGRALTLLLAVLAESLWFVLHIFRNHRRVLARDAGGEPDAARSAGTAEDGAPGQGAPGQGAAGQGAAGHGPTVYDSTTAAVELGSAVVFLWACALVMGENRAADMAPLLVLTTEQISGVGVGSALGQRLRVLVGGTAAVAASYAAVIALGDPSALGRSDVLIGLTGYGALAYLIRRGGIFLLQLSADLGDMSLQLHEQEQRKLLAIELHNHLGHTLNAFQRVDITDPEQLDSLRKSAVVARERLATFIATGRFSESVPLIGMVHRQVALATNDRLTVEPIIPDHVVGAAARILPPEVELLEPALRALLINVPRSAGVHDAVLHVDVMPAPESEAGEAGEAGGEGGDVVELVVTDHGTGFPPEVLASGVGRMRSLAVHERLLRERGGALRVQSVSGLTQVTLTLPIASATRAPKKP